jgi:hypothetical protein
MSAYEAGIKAGMEKVAVGLYELPNHMRQHFGITHDRPIMIEMKDSQIKSLKDGGHPVPKRAHPSVESAHWKERAKKEKEERGREKVAIRRSTAVHAREQANRVRRGSGSLEERRTARRHAQNLESYIEARDRGTNWRRKPIPPWSKERMPVHVPRTDKPGMSRGAKASLALAGAAGLGLVARHLVKKRRKKKDREQG